MKERGSQLFLFDQRASVTVPRSSLTVDPLEYAIAKGIEDVEEYTDDDGTDLCVFICSPKVCSSVSGCGIAYIDN